MGVEFLCEFVTSRSKQSSIKNSGTTKNSLKLIQHCFIFVNLASDYRTILQSCNILHFSTVRFAASIYFVKYSMLCASIYKGVPLRTDNSESRSHRSSPYFREYN